MIRLLVLPYFLALIVGSCDLSVPVEPQSKLEEFVSKRAGFKVKVPCKPSEKVDEYPSKTGKQYGYTYRCSDGTTRLLIAFGDHYPGDPAPLEKLFGYATGDYEFTVKELTVQKSEPASIGAFPAKRYKVSGNGAMFYTLVATNSKGSLTLVLSFPEDSSRPGEAANTDERMANEVLASVAFVSE